MAKVYSQRKAKEIEFVAVFVKDTEADARKFIKKFGLVFPAGLDPDDKIAKAYRFVGMPLTVFITKGGEIAERVTGPLDERSLTKEIPEHLQ